MATLYDVKCDCCGNTIHSREYDASLSSTQRTASGWESCLRRCERCGLGYSNANEADTTKLTIILRDPFQTLPNWLRDGCDDVLDLALNEKHRERKKLDFASTKSEDHATYVTFRLLQQERAIRATLARVDVGPGPDGQEPVILLWGAPVPTSDPRACALRDNLMKVSKRLKERSRYRSEPDVMLDFGADGLVIVEVKLGSRNKIDSASNGWRNYVKNTPAFDDPGRAQASGMYELARNWRIGHELGGDRPFTLVNLGPEELFATDSDRMNGFRNSLSQSPTRTFKLLTWGRLLREMGCQPSWFRDYVVRRGLDQPLGCGTPGWKYRP